MWILLLSLLVIALLLFIMIKTSHAAISIKQKNYDEAYHDTTVVAVSTAAISAIIIGLIGLDIYATFKTV